MQRVSEYRITAAAEDDLSEIWDWIAADNEGAASKLTADLRLACERAAKYPDSGSRHPSWTSEPVRFLLVRKSYYIVYLPATSPVEIVRVLHTARDIPAVLAGSA